MRQSLITVYASCDTGVKGGVYKTKRGKGLESEEGKGSQNGGRGLRERRQGPDKSVEVV
jgi:hypothetical protein